MHIHRPELLHPVQDAARLRALRGTSEVWRELDRLPEQLDELAACRAVRNDEARKAQARRELTGESPIETLGIWVYYPWSGTLIRVLPQAQFHELRLDRNRDKLTREEQAILLSATIVVVGLSVGSAVALTLAQEGVGGRLVLADFDLLSTSNLNRIRASVAAVGLPKTVVAARQIAELDPFIDVQCFSQGATPDNIERLFDGADIIVDECDDMAMKVQLRKTAAQRRLPVLMETSDRGLLDVERYDLDPNVPLLNGRLDSSLDPNHVRAMSAGERLGLVADSVGYEITTRAAASLLEVGATLSTWPQLASDVAMGGATVTAAARRILLGRCLASGLRVIDLDAALDRIEPATQAPEPDQQVRGESPASAPAIPPMSELQRALIEAAILAPSGGNCQPWAFRPCRSGEIVVEHDESRAQGMLDHDGIASLLAVGAAIEGMALRASQLGFHLIVEATGAAAGPVARASARPGATPDPLAAQLGLRFTDRRNPARVPLSTAARAAVLGTFRGDAAVSLVEDATVIDNIGDHIGATDRVRFLHPRLHEELWREIRWSKAQAAREPDGISLDELAVGPGDIPILRLLSRADVAADLRARGRGSRLAETSQNWCRSASALGVITVAERDPGQVLVAGRALHRMWLQAVAHGFAVQPVGVSLFMIRHLDAAGRFGYSAEDTAALRAADVAYRRAFALPPGTTPVLLFRILAGGPRYARTYRRPVEAAIRPPPDDDRG